MFIALASFVKSYITRADYFYRKDRPLLIAHRGEWGYYPEHALPGYVEAYYAGVDFIEFDCQVTKDGELVIQHDAFIGKITSTKITHSTTDIHDHLDRFKDRKR